MTESKSPTQGPDINRMLANLDPLLEKMAAARSFARANHLPRALDLCRRILTHDAGLEAMLERAEQLDHAGIFEGSDWVAPDLLQARLVPATFDSNDRTLIVIECLSELRILAISSGQYFHPAFSAEQATHFLTQVLAFNLQRIFEMEADESQRNADPDMHALIVRQLNFVASHIGYESILEPVVEEVYRLLRQRPIQVRSVRAMVDRIAACLFDPEIQISTKARGAEGLVSALYGPTQGCREDPGIETYLERVAAMDAMALDSEAQGFARAMHDTGLVSPYHAAFVRHVQSFNDRDLFSRSLGLSSTGRDCYLCYQDLVQTLTDYCIHLPTAQTLYGLASLLERGLLYRSSVAAALWRQMKTPLHTDVRQQLVLTFGEDIDPAKTLMAGIISVLGQPLGLGQGNNPACQSTRAISMWSYTDPDFLLQLARWCSRDNRVVMEFEGQSINSAALTEGMVNPMAFDLDPLSTILVPHLDRIYAEMGNLVEDRPEDPHRWINPEFHGWWVNRGFAIVVDIHTGQLKDEESFIRTFYALYHPIYNSNTPVVHPQPAGAAVTDGSSRFVGWHAITILRIALDQEDVMRVYFFNPNNDSGQDWGSGVVVSTEGHGEQHGESSLPIHEFVSRLYIFHYDATDWQLHTEAVPDAEIQHVKDLMTHSWAADRLPPQGLQAESN
ncbi:MAG: hypothetical protein LAT62_15215 [Natronospirillum sp.]|uniref:hypothetical protein n=1 Tax=Natronospirillum sp. TaxID=2812955 RepID=UPI0025FF7A8B|nr:hypothetical protein [Natronospirillum sp.]MCH8553287.1 hypothetical protein [Natronospirillum sp.]